MQPLFAATIPDASIITGLSVAFAALSAALGRVYTDARKDRDAAADERKQHWLRESEFVNALNAQNTAIEKLAERNTAIEKLIGGGKAS